LRTFLVSHFLAPLGLVGKMYSKIHSCWRGSGRNHSRHRGRKDWSLLY